MMARLLCALAVVALVHVALAEPVVDDPVVASITAQLNAAEQKMASSANYLSAQFSKSLVGNAATPAPVAGSTPAPTQATPAPTIAKSQLGARTELDFSTPDAMLTRAKEAVKTVGNMDQQVNELTKELDKFSDDTLADKVKMHEQLQAAEKRAATAAHFSVRAQRLHDLAQKTLEDADQHSAQMALRVTDLRNKLAAKNKRAVTRDLRHQSVYLSKLQATKQRYEARIREAQARVHLAELSL
jgi:hypothetical protein